MRRVLKRVRIYGSNLYRPRLIDLWRAARSVSFEPTPILEALSSAGPSERRAYSEEFALLLTELIARAGVTVGPESISMAMEREEVALIYSLVRARRPKVVVETGVASGVSTYFLLHALEKNQRGSLTSFDVSSGAGSLLQSDERKGWELIVLNPRASRREFRERMAARDEAIDLFIHDSDHSYQHQSFEYATALPHMAPDGLLASDDVDGCFAFLDFCAQRDLSPRFLLSPTKAFGIVELGGLARR